MTIISYIENSLRSVDPKENTHLFVAVTEQSHCSMWNWSFLPSFFASHLQSQLPQLVHLDQVGFIPSRKARDNTIKVLTLVHFANQTGSPSIFLSRLSTGWTGPSCLWSWDICILVISSVYSAPQIAVKANGVFLELLSISNRTRQGCPLSPLLFASDCNPFWIDFG